MIAAVADRVAQGAALGEEDAAVILESRDLIVIGMMADDVRRRMHGARTTFLRVFEVHCGAPPAAFPPALSAGEVRIVGTPASLPVAEAAVRAAVAQAGGVPVTGFSLADLAAIAERDGCALASACSALRAAGLLGVAEVPVDLVHVPGAAVQAARDAGLVVNRMTVRELDAERRIAIVAAARDLQTAVGGFVAFAPLPSVVSVTQPSTGYDDVKQIALARLMLPGLTSIQVDWALYGPKLAQVALTMGADDVDGVAAADPGLLGPRRSALEEIRGNIKAAALEPVERNARWESIGP